jgi:hypothetical protein
MIHKEIEKILDIIDGNFLRYIGKVPTITFYNPEWYNDENINKFDTAIDIVVDKSKYVVECVDADSFGDKYRYTISPIYYFTDNGVELVKKYFSIEEMIGYLVKLNQE